MTTTVGVPKVMEESLEVASLAMGVNPPPMQSGQGPYLSARLLFHSMFASWCNKTLINEDHLDSCNNRFSGLGRM